MQSVDGLDSLLWVYLHSFVDYLQSWIHFLIPLEIHFTTRHLVVSLRNHHSGINYGWPIWIVTLFARCVHVVWCVEIAKTLRRLAKFVSHYVVVLWEVFARYVRQMLWMKMSVLWLYFLDYTGQGIPSVWGTLRLLRYYSWFFTSFENTHLTCFGLACIHLIWLVLVIIWKAAFTPALHDWKIKSASPTCLKSLLSWRSLIKLLRVSL